MTICHLPSNSGFIDLKIKNPASTALSVQQQALELFTAH
jgi:hypothetical protein